MTTVDPRNSPRSIPADASFHFVLNGAAGSQDDEPLLQAMKQVLGAAGRSFELHRAHTQAQLQATVDGAVRSAGSQGVVVAVGGDGTINAVASALRGSGNTLGVVPRGTFNYFARVHGIALDEASAIGQLLDGQAHPVQVGRVNERLFLVNASLGLYPDLLQDREAFKHRFGRTRFVALGAGLLSLLHVHRQLSLWVDADGQAARPMRASTLFVGNNRLQLERIGLPEAAQTGHSLLTALVLRSFRPGELLWMALRGALGRLGQAADLTHFACQRLSVRPLLPVLARRPKVAVDGELTRLRWPLVFAIDEQPLWLIKPREAAAAVAAASDAQ